MHAYQPERRVRTSPASTAVRRFHGPIADELFVLCRPGDGVADATRQAAMVYEGMLDALAAEGVGLRNRGFDRFPCALVEAQLCRPELPCEADGVAILPPDATGA